MKKFSLFILSGIFLTLLGSISVYASYNGPEDLSDRIQSGDILFQTTKNEQTAAIMISTGSFITHMGIAEKGKDGEVRIIETGATVKAVPLQEWVENGQAGRVAVKRMKDVDEDTGKKIAASARSFSGRKYDPYFYWDDQKLYCSELVYKAFKANKIDVGKVEKISDLNVGNRFSKRLAESRLEFHPLCKQGKDDCWSKVLDAEIITPASIYRDRNLKTVYSNYLF